MASLSGADLRAALEFVAEVHEFESVESFRAGILPGLQRLVPGDLVGYNEVEPGGSALVVTYPEPAAWAQEPLSQLAHQHPLIAVQANGDTRTYKISDFLSRREFRSLALYAELYRRIGAEDQIAFGLPGPSVIGIAINRSKRSFSERDRALLDLLRPHLAQAHRRALERERTRALLAALERGLAEQNAAVAFVDRAGTVTDAGARASALLAGYSLEPRGPGARLPAQLLEWLGGCAAAGDPAPLAVEGERGTLTLRFEANPDGGWLLTLVEAPRPTPERLRELGLTPRQADVLALLATGAGVAEIAAELFLSPATVRKHIEHIYARLGVHTRAEAVARAHNR